MIITGEKLNSSVPSALRAFNGTDEDILSIVLAQKHADCLDINTALCNDEYGVMEKTVRLVLEHTDCAIMLDSPDPAILIKALPLCGARRTVINSVTPDKRINELLPLLASGGCEVVAMPVTAKGTPKTAEERFKTSHALVSRLVSGGVAEGKIYIDALAEAVSFDPDNGRTTLETLTLIKKEMPGVKTVLGISNSSFGLPVRQSVNAAFLSMAIYCGLDMAIIDVTNSAVMDAVYSSRVITGQDEFGIEYIGYRRS